MTEKYDLFSATFKINPFPTFAAMREDDPVYAHRAPDGSTIWYVTRYDDVIEVLKDHEHFTKDVSRTRPATSNNKHRINSNMLFSDPPDHTRLRKLVNKVFTPRRIERMRPQIQTIADALLDKAAPAGGIDLIDGYALPLPVIVICDLLGIPAEDREQITDWSQAIISPGSRGVSYSQRRRKMRRFLAYLKALFADRRARPQDDLTSALVAVEEAGDRLSEAELSSMVALLIVTGHETTVNLIGNGALALLQHPEQLALLIENRGWETAVEELLRYDGPVETSTTRWTAVDTQFKGHHFQRGDVVRVVLSSANRDAAHIGCPAQLDLTRQHNPHLAFGHGIHYCLGAPLARMEGQIALQTLFCRYPNLHLQVQPADLNWRSGILFRGLENLPVTWP